MEAFQHCGYLRGDADFSRGIEGGEPLLNLLTNQRDTRFDAGHPAPMAPGVFLENRPASTATAAHIASHLMESTLPGLLRLADVLDCRVEDGRLSHRVVHWQSCTLKSYLELLQDLATAANLEGFEGMAAEDLAQALRETLFLLM
jgi:hypothetical protein